jgi:hypothetical protein
MIKLHVSLQFSPDFWKLPVEHVRQPPGVVSASGAEAYSNINPDGMEQNKNTAIPENVAASVEV